MLPTHPLCPPPIHTLCPFPVAFTLNTVTIFAYGVTSSGKTHTMQSTCADPGVISCVVEARPMLLPVHAPADALADVMQIVHHYFENGITRNFTWWIKKCTLMACSNGEVALFMRHNVFLQWSMLQDAAFIDPMDGLAKIGSREISVYVPSLCSVLQLIHISMSSHMFSYYGIAASAVLSILNYLLSGFVVNADGFYMHSFKICLVCMVVFPGMGNTGYTLLECHLGHRSIFTTLIENMTWRAHTAVFVHHDLGATTKEVEQSNFWIEVLHIWKCFRLMFCITLITIAGMIILAMPTVAPMWQIPGTVILPLVIVMGGHILFQSSSTHGL
ncbi:hypothetical protein B0H17DRAFT_1196494 [Mycena rosella]|uniref:Uncharacterized protein n=1 Tax=Mycena rosella TaxID=1033263 RepID=A0AAD7GN78_MYCRO|nr:hypothetical protein B0H17DRAFT_1196494 [Mycena rosella]